MEITLPWKESLYSNLKKKNTYFKGYIKTIEIKFSNTFSVFCVSLTRVLTHYVDRTPKDTVWFIILSVYNWNYETFLSVIVYHELKINLIYYELCVKTIIKRKQNIINCNRVIFYRFNVVSLQVWCLLELLKQYIFLRFKSLAFVYVPSTTSQSQTGHCVCCF